MMGAFFISALTNSKRLLYHGYMMEQAQVTTKCPKGCEAVSAKAGKRADGLQRYRCGSCGKTFSECKEQENIFGTKQGKNILG